MESMDAAALLMAEISEPLTWTEIRQRYPDQQVCLVEIDRIHPRGFAFRTARVIGHGKTRREAFEQGQRWWRNDHEIGRYFTGHTNLPFVRPTLILDDETRDAIRHVR
jgi:hypothetical protein